MSLIRLDNIVKHFHGEAILDGVDLRVEEGEKIGLIGRNGCGKSTLFKIITGELPSDSGTVDRMRRARIAALAQIPSVEPGRSIHDIVMHHFRAYTELEERLESLEHRIADGDESALEQYGAAQDAFAAAGGYDFRARVKRILGGLGFREDEYDLPFEALSGGQRTRLMLALVLLEDADLLMLDEPENHLDLQAREWLEGFLKSWPKALIVISHDRHVLNEVTERIVEVERGSARSFSGNYDYYHAEKQRLNEEQAEQYRRQQEQIRREEAWIDRFRYKATKARQVQSRIKQLDKLDRVDAPVAQEGVAKFALGEVVRSGQVVLRAEHLSMAYGDLKLYDDVSFELKRGQRLGIIGPNGSGKTTFLRQLSGELEGARGEITLGHNCRVAVYDQHHMTLNPEREVIQELELAYPSVGRQELRRFMGRFLFTGDEVFKAIGTLSGGERSRVALAKLILSGANVLLLDEPTNHLDIVSREALESALSEFPGSIVMISHDRALLDRLVDSLLIFGDGRGEFFLGNYSHYRWKHQGQGPKSDEVTSRDAMRIRQDRPKKSRDNSDEKERRKRAKRIEEIESTIADLEELIDGFDTKFAALDPTNPGPWAELAREKEGLQNDLQQLYSEWDALSEEVSS